MSSQKSQGVSHTGRWGWSRSPLQGLLGSGGALWELPLGQDQHCHCHGAARTRTQQQPLSGNCIQVPLGAQHDPGLAVFQSELLL